MSHTRTPLAIALALAAVAATPAAAVIPHEVGQAPSAGAPVASVERSAPPIARMDRLRPEPASVAAAVVPASQTLVRPIVAADAGGFDWTDAGIGFAAAAGIALMGAGALAPVRWRRQTTRTLAH